MSLSIVIAVYNKPEVLRLVLGGYARQSWKDFEIIVADDGSGAAVGETIHEMELLVGRPIRHLWHEDRGWRKNTMLNNAIRNAQTGYMVFTDGDCIPHEHFVRDHAEHRSEGFFLCGRRAEMSARWSRALTEERIGSGAFERIGLRCWWEGITGAATRIEDGLRFESPYLRNILHRSVRGMLGSNFSVHRDALAAINGFDEKYDGPGCGEDSDVQFRLELNGLRAYSLRHLAIQYHVHHPRTDIPQRCLDRFDAARQRGSVRCEHGLQPITLD